MVNCGQIQIKIYHKLYILVEKSTIILHEFRRISVTNEQSGEYSDESEEGEDEEEEVYTLHRGQSAKDIKHCPCCKVGLWKPQEVNIRYGTR